MRGNAARAILPALAVLALVGVVAIAATGSTPGGSGDTRKPADVLLDSVFSLMLLALLPAAAILVYGLTQRQAIAREIASGRYRRTGFTGFVAFMLVFTAVVYWRLRDWQRAPFEEELGEGIFPGDPATTVEPPGGSGTTYEAEFAWFPVLVVLSLGVMGIAGALVAARRRGATAMEEESLAEALASTLEDTLDDLRAEADPRRAVIGAYARLERVLAAHGLARRAHETPREYLASILVDLEVDERAVRRLTDLFTRAKFSQHEVDLGMKEDAIDALEQVRDGLRARESEVGAAYLSPAPAQAASEDPGA